MMPRLRPELAAHALLESVAHGLLLVVCGVIALRAEPGVAQTPSSSSREELMRKWDIDRDGKVDAGEAEVARTRMRRARNDAMMRSGIDPVTGRPRVAIDPVTGRPVTPAENAGERGGLSGIADDGGLILLPGNGEQPGGAGGSDAATDQPARPVQPERPALPGTRVPAISSTIPSVAPNRSTGQTSPGSGAASSGPGMRPPTSPAAPGPPQSLGSGQDRRQPSSGRPGIISGGVRAGAPAVRPGYGSGGPPTDLNAGRLPGGMPQTRGTAARANRGAPGTQGFPTGQGFPGGQSAPDGQGMSGPQSGIGRPMTSGRSSLRTGAGQYRGAGLPPPPSTGVPGALRPGLQQPQVQQPQVQQPDGGRRQLQQPAQSRPPSTVPRVPRMSTDEFYGR